VQPCLPECEELRGCDLAIAYSCIVNSPSALSYLFLDKIHAPLQEYKREGDEISSFYVKRSRYIAFFGLVDLTGNDEGRSPQYECRPTQLNSGNLIHP